MSIKTFERRLAGLLGVLVALTIFFGWKLIDEEFLNRLSDIDLTTYDFSGVQQFDPYKESVWVTIKQRGEKWRVTADGFCLSSTHSIDNIVCYRMRITVEINQYHPVEFNKQFFIGFFLARTDGAIPIPLHLVPDIFKN